MKRVGWATDTFGQGDCGYARPVSGPLASISAPAADTVDGNAPLVTIVTPSLNQGEFIEDTIRSVLEQDYPRIEYLVLDGGSTDGTLDLLKRYEGRFAWVSEKDDGQSDAIDRGFLRGRGDILAWLNADDVYTPGAVSMAVEAFLVHPSAALVYGHADFIDRTGNLIGPHAQSPWDLDRLINRADDIPQPATFFRREAYAAVGGLDHGLRYCMDYDLWIRLGLRYQVRQIPTVLARMRLYPGTKTASGGLERVGEIQTMIARHGRARLPETFRWDFVRESARAGLDAARRGHRWEAIQIWARAVPYFRYAFVLRTAAQVGARRIQRRPVRPA